MPSQKEQAFVVDKLNIRVADLQSPVAVIVTHPWGMLGGNMHNNVVCAACLYFQRLNISTVRFDFDGSIGRGYAQVQQVVVVADALLKGTFSIDKELKPAKILLVGYSYGSLIAASASAQLRESCVACVSIAPPFGVQHWLLLFHGKHHLEQATMLENLPRLFLLGDKDNFTSERVFSETVAASFPFGGTTGAVLKGADHFFQRREKDVMSVIGQWLLMTFPACQGDLQRLRDLAIEIQASSSI
jgi:uncharacterized protein